MRKRVTIVACPPVLGALQNPDHFIYNQEVMNAWKQDRLSDDIKEEQRKLTQADLVIFQVRVFPVLIWLLLVYFIHTYSLAVVFLT